MWPPCPTCHHNKVKDTAVTVDNGEENMSHQLNVRKLERSAHVSGLGAFPRPHNDVPVISFALFKGLKGLMTEFIKCLSANGRLIISKQCVNQKCVFKSKIFKV